jgi:hypothetical protein
MIRYWRKVLLLITTGFILFTVSGQTGSVIFFKDSLSISEESYFLYNMVGLRLNGRAASLHLRPPMGWKLLGQQHYSFNASSDSVSVVSLTLIRQPRASAEFSPVFLQLEIDIFNNQKLTLDTFFYIRAPAIHSFSITALQPVIDVPAVVKQVMIPLRIYNKGTTNGHYNISLKSSFFEEPLRFTLRLPPGADSVVEYPLALPTGVLQNSPQVLVSISDSTGMIQSVPITLTSPRNSGKAHATPFLDFPAEFETGIMMTDRQYSFYGAARASWMLKEGSVDLSFRSKLYGPLNTIERNILTAQLKHKRWDLTLGQLNSIQHFFSYGRGFSVLYRLSSDYQLGAQVILPTVPGAFTNKTYSVWLQRRVADASSVFRVVANRDVKKGLQEYLLSYETAWQPSKNMQVKLSVAAGQEHFSRVPVLSNGALSLGGGYSIQRHGKKLEWTTSWQRFSALFPGVDKGLHTHLHQLRWLRKQGYLDLFYSYNSIVSTLLTDTIYLTDVFRFNSEKMGIRVGYRKKMLDFSFSTGWFQQTGVSTALLPRYQYGEIFFSSLSALGHTFSVKSLLGYANDRLISRPVFIYNTTFNYRFKSSGIRAYFLQQPVLKDSSIKVVVRLNQALSVSPYVGLRLWKRIGLQFRYNLSKTRFDERVNTSVGLTASWQQPQKGWQLSFSGTFPFSRSVAPGLLGTSFPFFNFSLKKALRLPLPLKRRYYNLTVITYADQNGNKRFDSTDRLLPGIGVTVGKDNFITSKEGSFSWKNIDTGLYRISITATGAHRGWLPPSSSDLFLNMRSSQTVMIAFSKSCIIAGSVSIELDTHSTLSVQPDHILVKATDSSGKEYSTLTDNDGLYFINVPAGVYTVSLNPEAFTGSIRPTVLYQSVDLRTTQEAAVNFVLQEKRRPIRILKQ